MEHGSLLKISAYIPEVDSQTSGFTYIEVCKYKFDQSEAQIESDLFSNLSTKLLFCLNTEDTDKPVYI